MTTKARKSAPAPKPEGLTDREAFNLLQLLNRVQTKGIQEAQFLGYIAHKLDAIRADFTPEASDGQNAP
jgi:hypothetical protein